MTKMITCPVCGGDGSYFVEAAGRDEICDNCGGSGRIPRRVVLRVSRHQATAYHLDAVREIFGTEISLHTEDTMYGDDPVAAVRSLVEKRTAEGREIVAVEAAGPEPVLQVLVKDLGIPVIRPVFRRDGTRVTTIGKDADGRDIFAVESYERLDIEVRPTIVGRPFAAV